MKNPYAWNYVNPDLCYGRDQLLGDLLNGLPGSPRVSFGIAGGRRMGKTTLLRRVEKELQASAEHWRAGGFWVIPIYLDGLALPRPIQPADVWGALLDLLRPILQLDALPTRSKVDFDEFKNILSPVLSNLSERPRVVVIFDEIEPLAVNDWANGFWANWRALLSNTPGLSEYFVSVFAGAYTMNNLRHDIGSPLADVLSWSSLKVLEAEDAYQLMQQPIELEWEEDFLRRAYQESGGHPMLLQYIMQFVCRELSNKKGEEALGLVDKAVVKFERERGWQFGEWWEQYCPPSAQRVYAQLPDDGQMIARRSLVQQFGLGVQGDLDILQHVGLVVSEDDGFAFRYAGEMFRRWYRLYGRDLLNGQELAIHSWHDPLLYKRLGQLGDQLADRYITAWKIHEIDLPNYSGGVEEMRGVLTLLLDVLAPEEQVKQSPSFQYESNSNKPTRRQRVRYILRNRYSQEKTKRVSEEVELFNEKWARFVNEAYGGVSGKVHTVATKADLYAGLKQFESILVQLLPEE